LKGEAQKQGTEKVKIYRETQDHTEEDKGPHLTPIDQKQQEKNQDGQENPKEKITGHGDPRPGAALPAYSAVEINHHANYYPDENSLQKDLELLQNRYQASHRPYLKIFCSIPRAFFP
jgi:hypothetical protein